MSIFAKAKTVQAKPTAAAKKTKEEIAIAGIQQLAEMKAMAQSLEAAMKTIEGQVKDAGFEEFLNMKTNTRPESFKGIDGLASCSVEMRKRGTNSALNLDEVEVLEKLGLKPFTQVVTTEMFGINPAYAADEKLMAKVSAALEKIVPEDFIVLQEGVSKKVVDDALCDAAFKMAPGEDRATALRLVTTMALKPRLDAAYDMSMLQKNVGSYLAPEDEEISELTAEGVALINEAPAPKVKAPRKAKAAA